MRLIIGFLTTFLIGVLLTMLVRRFARQYGIVSLPRQDRWHQKPTALLGGIAIYAAFVTGWLAWAPSDENVLPVLVAGTVMFVIGLIDDLNPLKPYIRLVAQLMLAAVVVYNGLKLPWTQSAVVNDLLAIFWLVGITNAINLLDNMDGLAGGITLISCLFLSVTFIISGQWDEAMLPLLLGGAVAGFLVFNFNPASIFMGDCGSTFLGFILGGIALLSNYGRTRNLTAVLFTPVLILMIPILDTCLVTVTRKLNGRSVAQGGRDHTSHRLVALGMSERRAVLLLYLFATASGALALMVREFRQEVMLLLIPLFALVVLFLGMYLGMVRVYEEGTQPAGNTIIQGLWDFGYKRRVFEVLLDVVLVALAYYGAYLIRFDGELPAEHLNVVLTSLPLVIVLQMPFFLAFGVYRGLWRYTGISDLVQIAKAVVFGTAFSTVVVLLLYHFRGPSRGASVLYALLLLIMVATSRLSFRLIPALIGSRTQFHPDARPVLIYSAGDSGEMLIREILTNPNYGFRPVGFVDEDQRKAGKVIHGYRIFEVKDMPDVMRVHGVSDVLIPAQQVSDSMLASLRGFGLNPRRMSIHFD